MPFPYYLSRRDDPLAEVPEDLVLPRRKEQDDPKDYVADQGLVDAVNVALLLGQPLLLTGEPGTGKTQLAYSVSWQLGFKQPSPLVFETKSTTTAKDLFYTYDTVGRFHAAQTREGSQDARSYITYNALGKAILLANNDPELREYLAVDSLDQKAVHDVPGRLPAGERRRSVVLIDEIDKAPRDFPNDILNEVERMYFKIPELGNVEVRVSEQWRPVLILTSNSEKGLPDAFLRRCVYYDIPFPEESLRKIVEARMGYLTRSIDEAISLFRLLRAPNSPLAKKPATAELLGWLTAIRAFCKRYQISEEAEGLLRNHADRLLEPTLCILIKNEADRNPARAIVQAWLQKS